MVAPGHRAWSALVRRARRLPVSDIVRDGAWLVIAPHPDDESLGCGALMSTIERAGGVVHTAFLTDGSGSHPDAPGWSASRIAGVRQREAGEALRALGIHETPLHLDWRDAAPASAGDALFERTVTHLAGWCRARRIRRIVVTWSGEPHCDHEAAAALAQAVARRCRIPVFDYLVWGWTVLDLEARLRRTRIWSVDTSAGRARQRLALACHRTQLGGRIVGARESFRLPRPMMRLVDRPLTLLLETRHAP